MKTVQYFFLTYSCSSSLLQATCHYHSLHPLLAVQEWDLGKSLAVASPQSFSVVNSCESPPAHLFKYQQTHCSWDTSSPSQLSTASSNLDLTICCRDSIAGQAGLSSFLFWTGSFDGGISWLAFILSSKDTRPDSGCGFHGLLEPAALESAKVDLPGIVHLKGDKTLDHPPQPLLDFCPFFPTAAMADSGFSKSLMTLKILAMRPLPSLLYLVLSSFMSRRNTLCTAAWLDMFLLTGRTSPITVALHELSLDDRSTKFTFIEKPHRGISSLMVKASFSKPSASTIWVSERWTSEPFCIRSMEVAQCAPIIDPIAISWCSDACHSSSLGVAGRNVHFVCEKFITLVMFPLFNHGQTWVQQQYMTQLKRQWQVDIHSNVSHNQLAMHILCTIPCPHPIITSSIYSMSRWCGGSLFTHVISSRHISLLLASLRNTIKVGSQVTYNGAARPWWHWCGSNILSPAWFSVTEAWLTWRRGKRRAAKWQGVVAWALCQKLGSGLMPVLQPSGERQSKQIRTTVACLLQQASLLT